MLKQFPNFKGVHYEVLDSNPNDLWSNIYSVQLAFGLGGGTINPSITLCWRDTVGDAADKIDRYKKFLLRVRANGAGRTMPSIPKMDRLVVSAYQMMFHSIQHHSF